MLTEKCILIERSESIGLTEKCIVIERSEPIG